MVWVKGELLTDLADPGVDPTGQLTRAAQPGLFNRIEWFQRIADDTRPSAILIARMASAGALAWLFLARQGTRAIGLSSWYSFAFQPVFAGDPDESHKRAMLIAAARRLALAKPRISSVLLSPLPVTDGTADLLETAFTKGGWSVSRIHYSTSWIAKVSGLSFEKYWAARPGQLRSTYKRKLAKAAFETRVYEGFDPDAWTDYEAVYADSWKPDEGSPKFLSELAIGEGKAGCLRLGICRIDGEAVAAQFWTVENGRALIHKLAHRESAKELSPGTILSVAMFRHVIDKDHVDVIDFGTGDDAYKADWMDVSAPLDTIEAYNLRSLAGAAKAIRAKLSRLVRRGANS